MKKKFCLFEEIDFYFYRIKEHFREWVYPGYYLKNLLFYRYDKIKIPEIKPWEYCDKNHLMFLSNMKLIVDFIDKENPEEYILWYKDEDGNDAGHKYGECKEVIPIMFPEYEGKWIMDIIKEIYCWYKEEYPKLCKEQEIFRDFYLKMNVGELDFSDSNENKELKEVFFDKSNCPKTLEELMKKDFNKEIIKKYLPNEEDWLNEKTVGNKNRFLEEEIERQKMKYLHLCIEVMPYLWT